MQIALYAFDGITMFHLAVPQMVFDEVGRQGLGTSARSPSPTPTCSKPARR